MRRTVVESRNDYTMMMIGNQFAFTDYKRAEESFSRQNLLKAHSRNSLHRFEARSVNSVFTNKSSKRSSFFLSKPKSQLTINVQFFTYDFLQKGFLQRIQNGHGRVLLDDQQFLSMSRTKSLRGLIITHTMFYHQADKWIVFLTKEHEIFIMEYERLPVTFVLKKLIFGNYFNFFEAEKQMLLLINKKNDAIVDLFVINFKSGRVYTFNLAPCLFINACCSNRAVFLLSNNGKVFLSELDKMEGFFKAVQLESQVLQIKTIRNKERSAVLAILSDRQYGIINSNHIQKIEQRQQQFNWQFDQLGTGVRFKDKACRRIEPVLSPAQIVWIFKQ